MTVGLFVYSLVNINLGEKYTEFYILGTESKASDYPRQLVSGEQAEVTLGIINEEQESAVYSIDILIDGVEAGKLAPININQGDKWEQTASFIPQKTGDNQRVEFRLFKTGEGQPYRILNIWINVSDNY